MRITLTGLNHKSAFVELGQRFRAVARARRSWREASGHQRSVRRIRQPIGRALEDIRLRGAQTEHFVDLHRPFPPTDGHPIHLSAFDLGRDFLIGRLADQDARAVLLIQLLQP
jgi:hypothetical protein